MAEQLSVRLLPESDYDRWRRFVASCPSGSIFALPEYLNILCQATGGRFEIVSVFQGSELVGGIALYFEQKRSGLAATRRPLLSYHHIFVRIEAVSILCSHWAKNFPIMEAVYIHQRADFGIVGLTTRHRLGI